MTTLPPGPDRPAATEPHRHRRVAESFGTDAPRYDRARPSYPQALIDWLVAASPGPDVLDVGCGTGIAARQFRDAGCRVLGVEPDARMAEFARGTGLEVEVGTFEDWDAADRGFDAVVAAQAWHWVDPVAGPAKAARLLRTGGRLAVFAHVFEPPRPVAGAQLAALRRAVPDSPFAQGVESPGGIVEAYRRGFEKFAEDMRAAGAFGEPEHRRFGWERTYTRAEWLDLTPTTGALTRLPRETLAEVLAEIGAAIDELGGSFTMSFTTLAVSAPKL
ncbi:class I SAM-dependent methyltransferase [Nocardia blacklockiae]|uniref:class I SAM-dependent methyltransferase n=1 Tax=Nocardia blacklockiae TaxID=480036 RepID=UPI0018936285|nr:class I SAM-dependent methyltransferase [Nocardia blacklockiae]MBF6174915.1 class I SAM-dependent methyltransferase [Nocardia blacklockiae]